ncbi:MAG TPA: hypothetical protein VGQ53_07990 [Chitinophagaceae bacterium]|jgi:hypothetical protein|nr:hypothetical protein [Chitinophagaceae bacterium]
MKILFISVVALLAIIPESCKKTYPSNDGTDPGIDRKISFQLYTDKDFSSETSTIKFSLFIRDAHTTLFDSSLAPMQLKDIPDAAHKIVIEKVISGKGNIDLAAGFHYDIENVGHAGFTDTSKAGNALKVIDYSFQ